MLDALISVRHVSVAEYINRLWTCYRRLTRAADFRGLTYVKRVTVAGHVINVDD